MPIPKIPSSELPDALELRRMFYCDPYNGILQWAVRAASHTKIGARAGGCSCSGYRQVRINGRHVLEHRIIWCWMTGEWPTDELDHINRNKLDNSWGNLRSSTRSSNVANSEKPRTKSPYRGVTVTQAGRWAAVIRCNGNKTHLGTFGTPEDASVAYREAYRAFRGEYPC